MTFNRRLDKLSLALIAPAPSNTFEAAPQIESVHLGSAGLFGSASLFAADGGV